MTVVSLTCMWFDISAAKPAFLSLSSSTVVLDSISENLPVQLRDVVNIYTNRSLLPKTSFHKNTTKNLSMWEVSYTASAIFFKAKAKQARWELQDVYAKCCIQ